MTSLTVALAVLQAGLLLWGAIHLSNLTLRPRKLRAAFWGGLTLAGALAVARYGAVQDTHRTLCSLGDCLVLAVSVAGARIYFVNKEEDRLAFEYAEAAQQAAAAAEAARQARKAEQLKAAAAILEARAAEAEKRGAESTSPPRHLTPSILRGGAPSPRKPSSPRS
jgi:hypothetical protein